MCKGSNRPYTGSIISSNPADGVAGHTGFQFTYGYIEARIFFPSAPDGSVANWPGLMTTGQNWPTTGENDIAEGLGGQIQYHFHSPSGAPGGSAGGNYAGGWHTFAAYWEAGVVTYYYDGIQVGKITSGITSASMYIVINNSQGQYGGATVVPADMLVKYIRIWQQVSSSISVPDAGGTYRYFVDEGGDVVE
jgi:beta-glucanase (GH16 family)